MTHASPDRDQRHRLLAPYRPKRTTPRADFPEIGTDPAPPWVAMTIDGLWPRALGREDVVARTLAWCAQGDPVQRAEQILTLVRAWNGPADHLVEQFLAYAVKTRAGRKANTKYKPREVVTIPREWAPLRRRPVGDPFDVPGAVHLARAHHGLPELVPVPDRPPGTMHTRALAPKLAERFFERLQERSFPPERRQRWGDIEAWRRETFELVADDAAADLLNLDPPQADFEKLAARILDRFATQSEHAMHLVRELRTLHTRIVLGMPVYLPEQVPAGCPHGRTSPEICPHCLGMGSASAPAPPRPEPSDEDRLVSRAFFGELPDPVSASVLNASLPFLLARVRKESFEAGFQRGTQEGLAGDAVRVVNQAPGGLAEGRYTTRAVEIDPPDLVKADLSAMCGTCLKPFRAHPNVHMLVGACRGRDIHELCDGTKVYA